MAPESSGGGRRLVLEEAALRVQLADIRAERAKLDARERALLGALDLFENGIGSVEAPNGSVGSTSDPVNTPSQREMIRMALGAAGPGEPEMSVSEIISAISMRFTVDLPRTSVSPTLAKMEAAGEVEHVGRRWRLSAEGLFDACDVSE